MYQLKENLCLRFSSGCLAVLTGVACLATATNVTAADPAPDITNDLASMNLEQLMNESVTSVSKKETKLDQSPAAIYVVTQDDIRRLGITTIPEALRLVPGLDVARITGNEWAVSSRGFNAEFAKTLLVMIDGRTVYTPSSSGVYWNAQDIVMEDIDRIEVIRGPGAALWGANAVNGVINIITKSAKETSGAMVSVTAGIEDQPSTTVQYGGLLATNLYYRAFLKYYNRDGLVNAPGVDSADGSDMLHGGFRMDWEPSEEDNFTFQGDLYSGNAGKEVMQLSLSPVTDRPIDAVERNAGGNVLGRWTRTFSDTASVTLQTYYDHVQQGSGYGTEYGNTCDADLKNQFNLGTGNAVVWGGGYRLQDIKNTSSFDLTWAPERSQIQIFNVFAQDDITLVRDRLHFTLGGKIEHNTVVGLDLEPNVRLLWTPTENQTAWAALSRATRTPSLFELGGRLNEAAFQAGPNPALVSLLPNPNLQEEKLTAYEIGYRVQPTKPLSFDAAGFYNIYDNLSVQEPNANQFVATPVPAHLLVSSTWQNADSAETYGLELSGQWQVTDNWRLTGSYTWLHMDLDPDPSAGANSPQHQFQVRSYLDLPCHTEFNGALYYVDQISAPSGPGVATIPAYFRLDLGLTWHATKSLEFGLWGQNLLDGQHPEFPSHETQFITQVPRGGLAKVTWHF